MRFISSSSARKLSCGFFTPGKADHFQRGGQFAIGGDIIERRNELAAGQIAAGTEDDHRAGLRAGARGLIFAERIGRFQNSGMEGKNRDARARRSGKPGLQALHPHPLQIKGITGV